MSMFLRVSVVLVLVGSAIWTQWVEIKSQVFLDAPPVTYVEELFQSKESYVIVEVLGLVSDIKDNVSPGIKRQEFKLSFPGGHVVEVSHDTTTTTRVPLKPGDEVEVRGEYIWTQTGGMIHLTNKGKKTNRVDGWINHQGKSYE